MASLVLIKPDAIQHKMLGWCIACFEDFGILDMSLVRMTEGLCDAHYVEHREKAFYPGLKEFMLSGNVCALSLAGNTEAVRKVAMYIREEQKAYVDGPRNLIHASDSILSAQRELDLWFPYRATRWNPWGKVVQNLIDGTIDLDITDVVRAHIGLPPWSQELAEKEVHEKPIFFNETVDQTRR